VAAAVRQGAVEENSGTLWAYGFHLGSGSHKPELSGMGRGSTERSFGHFGMGTCMGWADPVAELVVAFTTNHMLDEANGDCNRRLASLSNAIWDAIQE
jgi:CubicO group peptidase (beta-lactamase class C family)